jgi:hypothetical protein
MKLFYSTVIFLFVTAMYSIAQPPTSGNPIIKGWYADPEAAIFKDRYWIYPTYSDKYEKQVFFDAFSSKNLVQWKKHHKILDTAAVKFIFCRQRYTKQQRIWWHWCSRCQ